MAIKQVVATINGQEYTLNWNAVTSRYEATISAPSKSSWSQEDHKYDVQIKATDDAGNTTTVNRDTPTLGDDLQLRVLEKVAPTITVVSPSSNARLTTATPQITWQLRDNDSGIDAATIKLTINGQAITTGITKTPAEGGYDCSYTPAEALPEGSNTVLFDVADNDGNAATQGSVTFTVDTIAPSLNVTTPAEGAITNQETINVAGTTSDATSGPVTVTIKVNEVDQGTVTVEETGAFSKDVTLSNGANVIKITARDAAGKETTITRNITLDTGAPVFNSIEITPNPVDAGKTFIISVDVTDL